MRMYVRRFTYRPNSTNRPVNLDQMTAASFLPQPVGWLLRRQQAAGGRRFSGSAAHLKLVRSRTELCQSPACSAALMSARWARPAHARYCHLAVSGGTQRTQQ